MIDKYCVYIYSLHYVQREYIYHTTNRREEGNQTLRRSLPAERIRGCFAPPLLLAPFCSRGWSRTTTQAHTRCHKPSVKGRRSSCCRVHTDAMPPSLVSLPCIECRWSLNVLVSPVQWHCAPCLHSPLMLITPQGVGACGIYLGSARIHT